MLSLLTDDAQGVAGLSRPPAVTSVQPPHDVSFPHGSPPSPDALPESLGVVVPESVPPPRHADAQVVQVSAQVMSQVVQAASWAEQFVVTQVLQAAGSESELAEQAPPLLLPLLLPLLPLEPLSLLEEASSVPLSSDAVNTVDLELDEQANIAATEPTSTVHAIPLTMLPPPGRRAVWRNDPGRATRAHRLSATDIPQLSGDNGRTGQDVRTALE